MRFTGWSETGHGTRINYGHRVKRSPGATSPLADEQDLHYTLSQQVSDIFFGPNDIPDYCFSS